MLHQKHIAIYCIVKTCLRSEKFSQQQKLWQMKNKTVKLLSLNKIKNVYNCNDIKELYNFIRKVFGFQSSFVLMRMLIDGFPHFKKHEGTFRNSTK